MINAGKLQTVENIEDLAIYIKETKNKNLEKEDLIQVNAMLAHDVKWLKTKEVDDDNLVLTSIVGSTNHFITL